MDPSSHTRDWPPSVLNLMMIFVLLSVKMCSGALNGIFILRYICIFCTFWTLESSRLVVALYWIWIAANVFKLLWIQCSLTVHSEYVFWLYKTTLLYFSVLYAFVYCNWILVICYFYNFSLRAVDTCCMYLKICCVCSIWKWVSVCYFGCYKMCHSLTAK